MAVDSKPSTRIKKNEIRFFIAGQNVDEMTTLCINNILLASFAHFYIEYVLISSTEVSQFHT